MKNKMINHRAAATLAALILFMLLAASAYGQSSGQGSQPYAGVRRRRAETVLNKIQQGVEAAWAVCRLIGRCDSVPTYDGRQEGETLPPPDSYSGYNASGLTQRQSAQPAQPPRIYLPSFRASGRRRFTP